MSPRCARSGPNARAMVDGLNAEKLIPDLKQRLRKRMIPKVGTGFGQDHAQLSGPKEFTRWHRSDSSGSAIWACRWRGT